MKSGAALWISILLISLLTSACVTTLPQNGISGGRTYKATVDIRLRGFPRSFLVHLPPGFRADRPLPMVIVIHGAFDTAAGIEKFSGFSDLADREGFIAVYPNGFGLFGLFQHWNAGHCCSRAAAINLNDVDFLAAVIEEACTRLPVDRRRIYMTGFSNGGMMTYRFAAERGTQLAAIAPLSAAAGGRRNKRTPVWSLPRPIAALPVLTMHGSADERIPFDGRRRAFWSVQQSLEIWIERNHCNGDPLVSDDSKGQVRVTHWQQCDDNAEVILYELMNWDHRWPGRYFTADLPLNDPQHDFDAAEIIWNFFKQHQCSYVDP